MVRSFVVCINISYHMLDDRFHKLIYFYAVDTIILALNARFHKLIYFYVFDNIIYVC